METKTKCESASKALNFLLTVEKYNTVVTLKSKKTGVEYTYQIARYLNRKNGIITMSTYVETVGRAYKWLGYYHRGEGIRNTYGDVRTKAAEGLIWVLNKIFSGDNAAVDEQLEVYHEGNCLKCGRSLTDSESIKIGLGPKCRTY